MEIVRGQIQKVSVDEGIGRSSGKPYKRWVFEIDGKKYGTFDEEIGETFKVGDYVEMKGSQKGQYWNMEEMEHIADAFSEKQTQHQSENEALLRQILAEVKEINAKFKDDQK